MSDLFNEMMEEISEKDKKIADLEAKLAEKEKEKIEFAIKQLKEANRKMDKLVGYCDYKVWENFDQQIKSLKGEK